MTEDDARQAEAQMIAAMKAADTEALYSLFATDFSWVHGSGQTDSRATMVRKFLTGALKVSDMTPEAQRIVAVPGGAMVSGRIRIALEINDTPKVSQNLYSAFWIDTGHGPQLAHWQNTRAPE
ncbi:nuclear transport factor 2 family protein [Mesobacterium pallidum]|uniref:nuclear transport factor 2 family protein n=1 Tax=Mesobacterium pallidum TaxID=2872037 RepID=UPI001EE318BA|nr:nuclear transport factor 2 family protein [Mesobacterium pallidum]